VHKLIKLALGRRLGVVHVVDDGVERFDFGEGGSNFFVSHAAVTFHGMI